MIMKINRLNRIQTLLQEQESISIDRLCEIFAVSKNTIRRDIAELEKHGYIKKVYGGITLRQSNGPEPFAAREVKNQSAKKQVAHLAAGLVDDGDVIYIDSGTTTMHLIPFLSEKKNLTILTASVHVVNAAAAYPQINVIATGGTFYRPSNAFVGSSVTDCLANYNIPKAFLATTGFSISTGVTNASPLECEIKRYLTERSQTKILLADASKVGVASLMTFCQLKDLDYLITDAPLPEEYAAHLAEHHVRLLTPNR